MASRADSREDWSNGIESYFMECMPLHCRHCNKKFGLCTSPFYHRMTCNRPICQNCKNLTGTCPCQPQPIDNWIECDALTHAYANLDILRNAGEVIIGEYFATGSWDAIRISLQQHRSESSSSEESSPSSSSTSSSSTSSSSTSSSSTSSSSTYDSATSSSHQGSEASSTEELATILTGAATIGNTRTPVNSPVGTMPNASAAQINDAPPPYAEPSSIAQAQASSTIDQMQYNYVPTYHELQPVNQQQPNMQYIAPDYAQYNAMQPYWQPVPTAQSACWTIPMQMQVFVTYPQQMIQQPPLQATYVPMPVPPAPRQSADETYNTIQNL